MGPQELDQFQRKERPQMPLFLQVKTLLEHIRQKCFNLFNFCQNIPRECVTESFIRELVHYVEYYWVGSCFIRLIC